MTDRTCPQCGRALTSTNRRAVYCGSTCRARASERRGPKMLGGPANDPTLPSVLEPLETWLRARGLELHEMASPARCAAERIDGGQITAGDLASLVGALRTSLSELYRDAAVVNDPPPEPRLRGRALLVARHASPRTRRPL